MIWSPDDYLSAAVIAREAGDELLSRLDLMTIKPRVIVDMGCARGEAGKRLQSLYHEARVVALDQSGPMLQVCRQHQLSCLNADARQIPLKDQSVDMIFANMLLPWQRNPRETLTEWRRVLTEEGLLIFSALGPDTLKEHRDLFNGFLPQLHDMHDIGDLLLQCGFGDPVLDVSYITLSYQDPNKFVAELHASGMIADPAAPSMAAPLEASFEIIYGHAFAPAVGNLSQVSSDGVVYFPLKNLRR